MTDPFFAASILAPLAVYALSVPLPGPGFVIIAKASVSNGYANGSAAALGTTLCVALYAIATVLGVSALLLALPLLETVIQLAGGLYLLYIGLSLVREVVDAGPEIRKHKFRGQQQMSVYLSFRSAFFVGLGNPKMIAFFAGLLGPSLASDLSGWSKISVVSGIIFIDLFYHQALAFMMAKGRGLFSSLGRGFDAIAGGAMMLFGLHLIHKAVLRH